ncbi:MAG TPA: hypothetical protein VK986_18330 [Tepidisphaeraceae bacterium]|nr:hypothetical protein [Tepidisphaeraceae bacterium]
MNHPRRRTASARALRLLAGAVAMALPAIASAQGQIDTSRSNDASNRVGSGGRNGQLNQNYYTQQQVNTGNWVGQTGNAYVTGNVTAGRSFQGNVPYTDPYAFRGQTAGSTSDNFIKNSAGIPSAYTRELPPNQPTLYYGQSSTVQAPPGFVSTQNRGYVPPPPAGQPRGVEDQRLGVVDLNQPISPNVNGGQFMTRGTLTPGGTQLGVITGSALYGVREWNPQDPADRMFLENLLSRNGNAFNRAQIDPREVQRMREELDKTLNGERPLGPDGKPVRAQDSLNAQPLGQSFDSPADPSLVNKPMGQGIVNRPMSGGLGTDQGMRQFVLGNARKTNAQYSEMSKRLDQYYTDRKKTDTDFAREFNDQLRTKQAAEAKAKALAAKAKPGVNDVNPVVPPPVKPDVTPEDPIKKKKPQPVKVANLSGGVKAEGLQSVMKKAEGLMKEGKFASALDQYEAAETVAPNNPMIWLGRANAELGAGFFQRADAHIRQAFMTDKALLLGQYDLTGMLGEERLGKVVADLKDIANKDTKPMPAFLLAYVAYNTGHERQALGYLDLAEKRADGKDLFFKMVREHWALPEEGGAKDAPKTPEQNK